MRRVPLFTTLILFAAASSLLAADPEPQPLWPDKAPGALGTEPKDIPTMMTFLPEKEKATGTAVVITPGGGYGGVCVDREGITSAKWLNSLGIAAFVVDYRQRGRGYGHPAPLQDAQRAVRTVRAKAEEYRDSPGPDRYHGIFRRRAPCLVGRNAFRQRRSRSQGPDRPRKLPPRLHDSRLPRHRLR